MRRVRLAPKRVRLARKTEGVTLPVCYVCKQLIKDEVFDTISEKYGRYRHLQCRKNSHLICVVCLQPHRGKSMYHIANEVYRHIGCKPGSDKWKNSKVGKVFIDSTSWKKD